MAEKILSDVRWGYINSFSTIEISFDANDYPFMTANKASAILFFLNQSPPAGYSFSNNTDRWNIGGSNRVLSLNYSACVNSNAELLGGLLMHNQSDCPNGSSGLKKDYVRNDFTAGQTNFAVVANGILENGGTVPHVFGADDYITLGFYELSKSNFQEVSVYNKKIYFQQ